MKCLLFLGLLLVIWTNVTAFLPDCPWGYKQNLKTCTECINNTCGDNATCHNTVGSPYCQCKRKDQENPDKITNNSGVQCEDEDECEDNRCGDNTICSNTVGSYYCQCEPGFEARKDKFTAGESQCKDTNECLDSINHCGLNANCTNIIGSYICTCALGFVSSTGQTHFNKSHNVTCKDINECEKDNLCGLNALCDNNNGSYNCSCAPGFEASNRQQYFKKKQFVTCEDINECSTKNKCGVNAQCTNTNGSYFCTCNSGFVASNLQKKFIESDQVNCIELKCDRLGDLSVQLPLKLQQILDEIKSTCKQNKASGEEMSQILAESLDNFLLETSLTNTKVITAVFELVENTLPLVGQLMLKSNFSHPSSQTRVEMLVHRKPIAPHGPFNLSTSKVQFQSDWETAVGDSYLGFASAALFEYTDLNISQVKSFINNSFHEPDSPVQAFQLNSRVVTVEVTNPNTTHLKKPVKLRFSHLQGTSRKQACVFWDSSTEGGVWSDKGCYVVESNTSYTVCLCKHLSSFAVLLSLYEQKDVFELQLITWIGLALSLICLLICILTFWLIRSIQSTRNTIHLHLCISLFIADLIFLVGISQTDYKVACAVVAGLLHYFFLAVFCWMCLEGVQLFRMVVLVFNTTLSRGYLMAAGYGVPALIVIASVAANYKGYGTPRYCWLSLKDGFIWSFFGPVCVIIVVNAVFFMITVWKLAQKFNSLNPDLSNLTKIRTFTITAVAQLCILGTMWIFGCFQFDETTLVMSYLFTILNSLQGVLVFIMHCLLSKQVRDEYIRFLTCLTTRQKSSYSEFSTNQSSKSQVSKSIHNTGESKI